jgi:hypothetical protein
MLLSSNSFRVNMMDWRHCLLKGHVRRIAITNVGRVKSSSTFVGTILAYASITMGAGTFLNGRAYAGAAVTCAASCKVTTDAPPAPTDTPTSSPTNVPTGTPTPAPTHTCNGAGINGADLEELCMCVSKVLE